MRLRIMSEILSVAVLATPLLGQSNIDDAQKNAWSENIGWTNWRDANGTANGVVVGAASLSGSIWAENGGWINVGNGPGPYANTDGANFGVNMAPNGDLSGFAWGENIGWLNFGWASAADPNRPRFDSGAGRLRGWAWSENDGWVNLDDGTHFVAVASTGNIPTVSEWGLVVMTLLLLTAGTILVKKRHPAIV